jgi:tetratricopeptide (TPR) repeat protein
VDLATNLHAIGVLQTELGQTAEAAKSLAEALAIREALVKADPKNTAFQVNLASTQITLGDLDWKAERYPEGVRWWRKGLALFDAALTEEPQNTSLLRQAAYYQRSVAGHYGELGLFEKVASHIEQSLDRSPTIVANIPAGYAHVLTALGKQEAHRRATSLVAEAWGESQTQVVLLAAVVNPRPVLDQTKLLELAKKLNTTDRWESFVAGMAYYRASQFEKALNLMQPRTYTRSELLSRPYYAYWHAMAYQRLGQKEEAAQSLRQGEKAYAALAQRCLADGVKVATDGFWWDVAVHQALRREAWEVLTAKQPPPDPWEHLILARAYRQLGEVEKADAELTAAFAAAPSDAEAWQARGQGFAQLGQHDRAQADFAKAVELKPNDPQLWIARGRYFSERGEHQKADADFARAAALTPDELNRFLEAGWWVAGPYPEALKTACPPEHDPDPSRPVAAADGAKALPWKRIPTGNHQMVEFRPVFSNARPISAYALNYVFSPEERTALLLVGGNRDVRVWLNGRLVYEAAPAATWTYDLQRVPVTLRAGRNTLLAKASSAPDSHWLIVRIADGMLDRADALAELGLWDEAAALYRKGFLGEREEEVWPWNWYAALLLATGDRPAYREQCVKMRERFRTWSWSGIPFNVARACALAPDGSEDAGRLVELAQKGQEPIPSERWRIGVLGWAYYRAGKYEDCVRRLTEIQDLYSPSNDLFLAMAHHRLGHRDEARKWLTRVEGSYAEATRAALKAPSFHPLLWGWQWFECAEFVSLRREAKALIEGTAPEEDLNLAALQARGRQFLKGLDPKTAAYDGALARQQDQPRLWLARGWRYADLKRWNEAEADQDKAALLKPDDPEVWAETGRICAEHGRPDQAAESFARSLGISANVAVYQELERWPQVLLKTTELRPDDPGLLAARGRLHALCRRWDKAAADFARAVAARPDDPWYVFDAAGLHLLAGDIAAYQRYCRSWVERFAKTDEGAEASALALVCGYAPVPPVDPARLVEWGQKAVAAQPERPWYHHALGLGYYRAGQFQEAVQHLNAANTSDWEWRGVSWPVLAMAHHRLGNAAEARQWLMKARQWLDAATPKEEGAPAVGFPILEDWLTAHILQREAESLLKEPLPKDK